MPGAVRNTKKPEFIEHLLCTSLCLKCSVLINFLIFTAMRGSSLMRNRRHREIEPLIQGHRAGMSRRFLWCKCSHRGQVQALGQVGASYQRDVTDIVLL